MDEVREKRVRKKLSGDGRIGGVDRLRNLPDCLLHKILLDLPMKEVVRTSLLSSEWRDLWKYVPRLDLAYVDFFRYNTFVSFVNRFLDFDKESRLESFRLRYKSNHSSDVPEIAQWINVVVKRKVEVISVFDHEQDEYYVQIPSSIYTCESLVSLVLGNVVLATPKTVCLRSLKIMDLNDVSFINAMAFKEMISGCPVLESLSIKKSWRVYNHIDVLYVCSRSLVSFTFVSEIDQYLRRESLVVTIDAPKLEYLKLSDQRTTSFVIKSHDPHVEVDIDIVFPRDQRKKEMIREFPGSLSRVEKMTISSKTLKVICDNASESEPLPLFHNMSFLRVEFSSYKWERLPIFLKSCTNLKTLVVGSTTDTEDEGVRTLMYVKSRCVFPSLEYILIERPFIGEMREMTLMSFLLENSTNLKKLALCLDDSKRNKKSTILKKLHDIKRLSKSCQIVIL